VSGNTFLQGRGDRNNDRFSGRNLLAVDTKSLDSEAELKRFFGAKVVSPNSGSSS
jgi:hypothetical protein